MLEIDCFGEICPVPLIRAKDAYKKMNCGETIKVVSDHSCVVESIRATFNRFSVEIETEEVMNGVWEIYITKVCKD